MFDDRTDAGERLGDRLRDEGVEADLVLAIPRGGLPVGRTVADALSAPLDVVVAKKIGAPFNPELAVGAVAPDGPAYYNEDILARFSIPDTELEARTEAARAAAREKRDRYRADREPLDLAGKRVVIVDDGVATGATMTACVRSVREDAAEVIVAVPVGSPETVERLRAEADAVHALETPGGFMAVGQYYADFEQVQDEEAMTYLD